MFGWGGTSFILVVDRWLCSHSDQIFYYFLLPLSIQRLLRNILIKNDTMTTFSNTMTVCKLLLWLVLYIHLTWLINICNTTIISSILGIVSMVVFSTMTLISDKIDDLRSDLIYGKLYLFPIDYNGGASIPEWWVVVSQHDLCLVLRGNIYSLGISNFTISYMMLLQYGASLSSPILHTMLLLLYLLLWVLAHAFRRGLIWITGQIRLA